MATRQRAGGRPRDGSAARSEEDARRSRGQGTVGKTIRQPANLSKRVLIVEDRSLKMKLRSEEHTSELQSPDHLVCRLLLEKKKQKTQAISPQLSFNNVPRQRTLRNSLSHVAHLRDPISSEHKLHLTHPFSSAAAYGSDTAD